MAGWLCRAGEPLTQADLARHADIHAIQVSLMLKALEAKGLVNRPRSASDTRAKRIEITAAGLDALQASMPIVMAIQQRMFGKIGGPGGVLMTELQSVQNEAE